jgi:hypothetical protein
VLGHPVRRRPVRATIGFFAHVVRRGRLRLGRHGVVLSAFSDVDLDAPLLRVRVLSLFGTVDVWHVPSGLRGSYQEITRTLQAGQRDLPG